MKVKRFDNLWTMGVILFGAILVAFYIAKIFFPEFIIGVAETPHIVEIGKYIDSHEWASHLFNVILGIGLSYFLVCACCKTYKLDLKSFILFASSVVLLRLVKMFLPQHYVVTNYMVMLFYPFIICCVNKTLSKETFISTICCLCIDTVAQILSVEIRNLCLLTMEINSATMLILTIDVLIWRILLYLFFNNKIKKEEEKDGV